MFWDEEVQLRIVSLMLDNQQWGFWQVFCDAHILTALFWFPTLEKIVKSDFCAVPNEGPPFSKWLSNLSWMDSLCKKAFWKTDNGFCKDVTTG